MQKEDIPRLIDSAKLVELTREMIQTPTVNPPGDEVLLAELLAERMSELGLDAAVLPFDGRRSNVFSRIPGSGRRSALVFCGHLDTVPFGTERWEHGPLSADVSEGKIYGRGASDMKGGVAAMIAAASAVRRSGVPLEGDLVLAFTAGEEVDSAGAQHMIDQGLLLGAGALLIAEPTGLDVCVAEKGALWLEAVMKGKAAHGSSPNLGKNAIVPMADFVQRLLKLQYPYAYHPLLGEPTINIATIEGGFKTNVVPDRCRLTIDFRTVPGQDHVKIHEMVEACLRETAEKAAVEWDLRILNERNSVHTPPDDPFVKLFVESARELTGKEPSITGAPYYTDGAVLAPSLEVPMVICGPGDAACAHQADEWVSIDKLEQAARIYTLVASRMLGQVE